VRNAGLDAVNFFHNGAINFRGYDPDQAEGLPSLHVPVPKRGSADEIQKLHVDAHYPYEDAVGLVNHAASMIKSILMGGYDW
jgi:hypothetical protein